MENPELIEGHIDLIIPIIKWATFWITLNMVVLPHACERCELISDWFVKQKRSKQIEFCGCMIAGIHGTFAAGSSIVAICFDESLNHLDIHGYSSLLSWQFKMTAGYFISDTISMSQQGPDCKFRNEFFIHHVVCGIAIYTTMKTSLCYYFIAFKMMTELSTPFMNISLILEMSNAEKNWIYYWNGHLFYWTFLLTRPITIPFYWWQVSNHLVGLENVFKSITPFHLGFNILMSIVLDVLNIIWTAFISKDYHIRLRTKKTA